MKKSLIYIILGVVLLSLGSFLYLNGRSDDVVIKEHEMTKEEANNVTKDLINDVIKVYENPLALFKASQVTKDDVNLYQIDDYESVIKNIFNNNGISQFENMTFENKKYVLKIDNFTYFLTSIPQSNSYIKSKISIDSINFDNDKITAQIIFSNSEVLKDEINYYVITKTIEIVKENDKWLVSDFDYSDNKE